MLQKTFTSILTLFFSILELVEKKKKKIDKKGIPWRDSAFSLLGPPVQFLVQGLRSHKPRSRAKKRKKKKKKKKELVDSSISVQNS